MELPVITAGKGEPLLMIHGIISDGFFFYEAANILKEEYKVIRYDRRGYGDSKGKDITDFSVAAQAEDASEILKTYAGEPAWILGNSAGGLIAIELCLRYPELVKGLILLEPSLTFDEISRGMIREWNLELNGYRDEKKTKKALLAFARVTATAGEKGKVASMEELFRTYKNLDNFMHGELNDVQRYTPDFQDVKNIPVPVHLLISDLGADTLFGKTSRAGGEMLGWQIHTIHGYHNAIKDNPESSAELISQIIKEMKDEYEAKCTI